MDDNIIGNNIKEKRVLKGLTQKQLAYKTGLTRESIGNYERGDRIPQAPTLEKIAHVLSVPISELMKLNHLFTRPIDEKRFTITDMKTRFDKVKPLIDYIEPLGYEIDMFEDNGFLELTFEKNTYLVSEEEFTELFKSVDNIIDLSIQGLIKNSKKKPKQK